MFLTMARAGVRHAVNSCWRALLECCSNTLYICVVITTEMEGRMDVTGPGTGPCNPELASVLRLATASRYKDRDDLSEAHAFGQQMNMEGVMSDLVRWQSQKQIPLWTALTSVDARRFQVVGESCTLVSSPRSPGTTTQQSPHNLCVQVLRRN